jgi:hypothetical protein
VIIKMQTITHPLGDKNMASLCKLLIGAGAIAVGVKYLSELDRTGDFEGSAWSTMEGACNVVEDAANWTANKAKEGAAYAKEMQASSNNEANLGEVV